MDCQKYAIKLNIFKQTLEVCEKIKVKKSKPKICLKTEALQIRAIRLLKNFQIYK